MVYEFLGFTRLAALFLWMGFLKKKAELDAAYKNSQEWIYIPPILKFTIDFVRRISRPLQFC